MTNPEIISYVKDELQKGTDRQTITNSLISNGWSGQDIAEAFSGLTPIPTVGSITTNPVSTVNRIWTKVIPRTNIGFLIPCLLLVFGLNMMIALNDRSLREFWYIMLGVFAAFAVFFILENFVFKKLFANSQSDVDIWISTLVVLRNILVLLNVIPLIQLLGMLIGFYAVWVYVPLYIILIIIRFNQTRKVANVAGAI